MRMKAPKDPLSTYQVCPEAWERGMERIRKLSPWQHALVDPELLRDALKDVVDKSSKC